jgi:hypothetical protein
MRHDPPSIGLGFAPNLKRIIKISGALACKQTRNGEEFPHDSIGTSTNLQ